MSQFYDRMCNIIKRILERVLAPVPTTSPGALSAALGGKHDTVDAGGSEGFVGGVDFGNVTGGWEGEIFEWPEFLDWGQEAWMEVLEEANFV